VPEDEPLELPPPDDELEEAVDPDEVPLPELPVLPAFGGCCWAAWVDPAPPGSLPPQATSTQAPRKLTRVRIAPVRSNRRTSRDAVSSGNFGLRTLSWARDGEVDHGEGLKRRAT
jgi:hypothetical protein